MYVCASENVQQFTFEMPLPICSFIKVSYNIRRVKEIRFTGDKKPTIISIRFFAGYLL